MNPKYFSNVFSNNELLNSEIHTNTTIIAKTKRQDLQKQLNETPVTLCKEVINETEAEKYLGDYLSCGGLAHSVHLTVSKRKHKVINSIFELKASIEDCRSNMVGGLVAGIDIGELSIIPFLLTNSETLTDIQKRTLDMLDDLQLMFLRCLFKTPRTCPKPALM